MIAVYTLTFLALLCITGANKVRKNEHLHEIWNDLVMQTANIARCHSCGHSQNYIERTLNDLEVKNLRIEIVKQTILKQLGMSKVPEVDLSTQKIPHPIREGFLMLHEQSKIKPTTHYKDRIIVVSSDVKCYSQNNILEIVLKFNLPSYLNEIDDARLWFHLSKHKVNNCKLQLAPCVTGNEKFLPRYIKDYEMRVTDGWSEIDIGWALVRKFDTSEECYTSKITCDENHVYDYNDACEHFSNNETATKPFLLVDVRREDRVNRVKRNVNCTKGITECCRENLYVSFADIGWGNWIIKPTGYNAYYCKGNCANAASISLSQTPYHSVIHKLYNLKHSLGMKIDVAPCCTPRDFSPVQLIYIDHNKSYQSKIIPNLTVETCGCV